MDQTDMKLSRTHFLRTISLLPLAGLALKNSRKRPVPERLNNNGESTSDRDAEAAGGVKIAASAYSIYDPRIEIYPDNMRHNVREISDVVGGRPIMAVIKNNGYGMGILESARILEPMQEVLELAVVKLSEALKLRNAGITKPILLLALCEGQELEIAVQNNITPMVYTPIGDQLERLSRRYERTIPVEVKLDTGLGRIGLREREAMELYRDLAEREGVRVQGSFITFTEAREFDSVQLRRFLDLAEKLSNEGLNPGRLHAASTTPIFRYPDAYLDMVRPGIGLYGIYPQPDVQREKELIDLKPAFGLKCRVIHVKQLKKGETAGYGQAFKAEENTWLATLPVGHADGWQRSAANCANVRINGRLYPVVASVSASHTLVALGSETDVQRGDEAVIFDDKEGSRPDDITRACGTSAYDLSMHLNPDIPREFVE